MSNKIFSIKTEKINNVLFLIITVCGIKIKFKNFNKKEIKKDKFLEEPQFFPIILTDLEKNLLTKIMNETLNYLEFGSGGSTFLALFSKNTKNIISIESDENWLNYLREWKIIKNSEINKRLLFKCVNIGPIGEYGVPTDESSKNLFPDYSSLIFKENYFNNNYDTVFIDGRFRVACALQTILNCPKTTKILIHDFSNREEYHFILKYLDIIEVMDTLCLFKIKDNINFDDVQKDYEIYKYNFK